VNFLCREKECVKLEKIMKNFKRQKRFWAIIPSPSSNSLFLPSAMSVILLLRSTPGVEFWTGTSTRKFESEPVNRSRICEQNEKRTEKFEFPRNNKKPSVLQLRF
jgi:hypothetical protein